MNVILLSGGSGTRLWPFTGKEYAKQFLKILHSPDGTPESMLQRVFRQIKSADGDARVTVATCESQLPEIRSQLGDDLLFSLEPVGRDTFPAIALAAAFLADEQGVGRDEVVAICPADGFVGDDFFCQLGTMAGEVRERGCNLMLMGINPEGPSRKYGYIIPQDLGTISAVKRFTEKPSAELAADLICQGALWNAGVFVCRLGYLLSKSEELLGTSSHRGLLERYGDLERISFDKAVVQQEPDVMVMRYRGAWMDMGTWDALAEVMGADASQHAITGEGTANLAVFNATSTPVIALGVTNTVIAVSERGILVADLAACENLKAYVDRLEGGEGPGER